MAISSCSDEHLIYFFSHMSILETFSNRKHKDNSLDRTTTTTTKNDVLINVFRYCHKTSLSVATS